MKATFAVIFIGFWALSHGQSTCLFPIICSNEPPVTGALLCDSFCVTIGAGVESCTVIEWASYAECRCKVETCILIFYGVTISLFHNQALDLVRQILLPMHFQQHIHLHGQQYVNQLVFHVAKTTVNTNLQIPTRFLLLANATTLSISLIFQSDASNIENRFDLNQCQNKIDFELLFTILNTRGKKVGNCFHSLNFLCIFGQMELVNHQLANHNQRNI